MKMVFTALLMVAFSATAAETDHAETWQGERLTIRVRAGAIGNLAWQLDTLSGHTNTLPKDYQALWRNDLSWSPEDARRLEQWSALHRRFRRGKSGRSRTGALYPPNYARYYGNAVGRDYAFRTAALDAADWADLRQRYQKLCGKSCAGSMVAVLQHFWPRFSGWWETEGLPTAKAIIPKMAKQMTEAGLGALCESAVQFTASQVPARHTLTLDVAVHPKKYLTNYTATVMDNYILMEVVDDPEVGGPRLPLAIHELTHHFYDFAPVADHLRLIQRFAGRPEPYSMAAYSLLNEAIATGVQLLVEKRMRTADDLAKFLAADANIYDDPFIAKCGRATAPLVEQWLANRGTLFDDAFVAAYLGAVGKALGELRESPRLLLSSRALIHGPAGKAARDEWNRTVRGIMTADSWKTLRRYPDLGGVVFATKGDLPRLLRNHHGVLPPAVVEAVQRAARDRTAFTYPWRRSPRATVYFLYGETPDRLLEVTRSF